MNRNKNKDKNIIGENFEITIKTTKKKKTVEIVMVEFVSNSGTKFSGEGEDMIGAYANLIDKIQQERTNLNGHIQDIRVLIEDEKLIQNTDVEIPNE